MTRQLTTHLALMLTLLSLVTGCHPTQPFYLQEDGDLSHYLDTAQQIEQPDYDQASLDEVVQSHSPFMLSNFEIDETWDLSLEECVSIALQNSKIIRTVGGTQQLRGNFAATIMSTTSEGSTSVYDPAIVESTTNPTGQVVDSQGNRVQQRGAARANQTVGVEDALAEFDAQFFSAFNYSQTDRPRNTSNQNPFNPLIFQATDANFLAAVSKRTATGSIFTFRGTTAYSRNNIPIGLGRALPSDWTQTIEAEWTQPLLRNRGTQVNRIPVILARTNADISLADFETSVRNLVLDVENAYWDLHTSYRSLETAKTGRDSAQVTWKNTYLKSEAGATGGDAQAEAQSREQYYFFRAAVQTALAGSNVQGQDPGLLGRERQLRFLMGLAPSDGRLIRPIDEPTMAPVEFQWHDVQGEALFRSPELRRQKWRIKQRELELISARNQLLPELNVSGVYRFVGVGDELIAAERNGIIFPNPGSRAWEVLTGGDFQEAGLRVDFTPPAFGARRELARVRNVQLSMVREQALLEDKELALTHQLSDALVGLDSHYHLVQTHFQRWIASTKEVNAAELLVDRGKAPIDILLDAQRRRANAQIDYYRALSEYNKSVAYVHYLKGSLLEFNNIVLDEGPWPQKAYWDALGRARERDASYYLDYGWTRPNVISRGPAPQHGGEMGLSPLGEEIDTPLQPTPAGPASEGDDNFLPTPAPLPASPDDLLPPGGFEEAPLPTPMPTPGGEGGNITRRPAGPALNAPGKRADAGAVRTG
ncbi:MAG: TolC family protein, partial [Planctomycetales bacterium]|nr:TolC family protein [Planctomycetales bacterium]